MWVEVVDGCIVETNKANVLSPIYLLERAACVHNRCTDFKSSEDAFKSLVMESALHGSFGATAS